MLTVTVKTLDAQNHDYSVEDHITVKEFKDKIAPSIGITTDKQRLIFCGRVLQDDKKLSEYDVNGKVIHLVQRPPPQQRPATTTGGATRTTTTQPPHRDAGSFLLGAFTIPQDMINPAQVEQIVQDVVSGMGEIGRNATVMSRTSEDGSSVDVHINLGHVPWQSAAQLRIQQCQNFLTRANQIVDSLENNSTTESGDATAAEADGNRQLGRSLSDTQLNSSSQPESQPQVGPTDSSQRGPGSIFGRWIDTVVQASRAVVDLQTTPRATSTPERQERISRSAEDVSSGREAPPPPPPPLQGSATPGSQPNREPNHPRTAALATVMDSLQLLQRRIEPHLDRYRTLLRDDPEITDRVTETQQFFSRISQVMHYLGHIYHSISDLSVSFGQVPPRVVRARLMSTAVIHPSAVIHAGFPLQAHVASARMQTNVPPTSTTGTARQPEAVPTSSSSNSTSPPTSGANNGTAHVGGGILDGENPVLFMEMGPGSIPFELVGSLPEIIATASLASQANGAGNQPTFSSTTTVPTTSGSTGTRTSTTSSTPVTMRTDHPYFFDPCLPCNSRWAAGGQGAARSAAGTQTRMMIPPQDDQLHQMIGGLMSALLQQPPTTPQNRGTGRILQFLQDRNAASRAQSDRVPTPTRRMRNPLGMFADLLQGASEPASGAATNQNNTTLADFLSSVADYSYVDGESIITDLFMCIARVLTFQELMNIIFGRTEALGRIRESLRQFILQRCHCANNTASPNEISIFITDILDQWQDSIAAAAREANVRAGVDYQTTMNNFLRNRLERVMQLVFDSDDQNFGSSLYELCRTTISELILLNLECFEDRETSLHRVIQGRIRDVTSNVNPLFRNWLLHVASTEITAIIGNAGAGNVSEYVVRSETTPAEQATSIPVVGQAMPMDQGVGGGVGAPSCIPQQQQHTREESMAVDDVVPPETWHSAVPQEWVPIIGRDIQRQRRQNSQHSFSDAYLVGMPSKRRRIMAESQDILRPTHTLLPQVLQRAINTTQAQPVTSLDRIRQEAAESATLHSAYREQVRSVLRERLQNDIDYQPERFPHSERYFNND